MIKKDNYVVKLLRSYASKQKSAFARGFLYSFSRTILEILSPLIIGYAINNLIKKGMSESDF